MAVWGKTIHEVEKSGNLYYLINAFIGAYNRRTDVLQKANETDPATLKTLADRLNQSTAALDAAVKANQPPKGE